MLRTVQVFIFLFSCIVHSMKESDIQKQILDYLLILENMGKLYYSRFNTVGIYDPKYKGYRKPSIHNKSGIPDIMVIKDRQVIFLEVKSDKGKQSEAQHDFHEVCRSEGILYYVVRSLDEVINIINAN